MILEGNHSLKHHLFRLRYTELNEMYLFMSARSFALSMIGIFIPVYLYLSDYGFQNILLLYALLYLTEAIFEYLGANLLKKIGPKHLMVFSLPFTVTYFLMLLTLPQYHWPPYALAFPIGVSLALFWEAYHYDFSRCKTSKKAASQTGLMEILLAISGAAAPFFGGYIAAHFGIPTLIIAILTVLVFGSFFLFKTGDHNYRPGKLDLKKINLKSIRRDLLSYAGLGWETCSDMQIWPLLLVIFINNYESIGVITSLSLTITIMVTAVVMKWGDKGGRTGFLKVGGVLSFLIGVARVFVESVTAAFAVNIGRSFTKSMQKTCFDSEYYLHADEESRSEYIFVMEETVDLARVFYFGLLYALSFFLSYKIVIAVGLVMGAFGAILIGIMPPAKCEYNFSEAKIKLTPQPKRR